MQVCKPWHTILTADQKAEEEVWRVRAIVEFENSENSAPHGLGWTWRGDGFGMWRRVSVLWFCTGEEEDVFTRTI